MPLWSDLVHFFEKGGKSKTRLVDGQKAKDLLRTVDDMLDESFKLLIGMKRQLTTEEYETYEAKHQRLLVMVVEVKSDARSREAEHPDFFSDPVEQAKLRSQVQKLFRQCQTYHSDVVSASRRIQDASDPCEETSDGALPTGSSLSQETTDSNTRWLSVVAGTGSPSGGDSESQSEPEPNRPPPTQPFIATIAHVPQNFLTAEEALAAQCGDENAYYRILICGNKYKRVVVLDPNPHQTNDTDDDDAELSQDNLLQVGDMMMRSDSQSLAAHPVVNDYRGPSFITSFISTLSLGTSSLPLGGMV